MIEYKNVNFNLHPSNGIVAEIREMAYKRGAWSQDDPEDMIECLVDMFVGHGNRCCEIGRKLET